MKPSSKRKRSENWDSTDKLLLHQLIQNKFHIIENKNVDTNISMAKRAAWKDILLAFNKQSNTKRNFPQIYSQWKRMKLHMKKRATSNGSANRSSAGGCPIISKSPEHLLVYPKDEFIVDHSVYDDYESSIAQGSVSLNNYEYSKDRYSEKSVGKTNAADQHFRNKCEEEIETLRLERSLKLKAFEADERRKDEEHQMRLQFMEEEHQLKIELLTEKIS
ncbi:uncharacterized protein LOC129940174 isoform X1 [Eupeodes corollae]|uniref:uncharacterized protein LOC129940174 isoform X1 n=1 Tax=Eupeodes corollae TaxID=290404 RepID=UPI0024911DED|nr:uncharacterized protein LOC129940174 isoform X1 [Eupeodes corollae]